MLNHNETGYHNYHYLLPYEYIIFVKVYSAIVNYMNVLIDQTMLYNNLDYKGFMIYITPPSRNAIMTALDFWIN